MKNKTFFYLILFVLGTLQIQAAGPKEEQIAELERVKAGTVEYMEAMSAEGYDFKPTPEMRSFAQQMLHLAQANYMFGQMAGGLSNPKAGQDLEKMAELTSKDVCMATVVTSFDFLIESMKGLSEDQLAEEIKLFNAFTLSRLTAFRKAQEHAIHHRAQTTVYLRLKGFTPPSEKLF